MKKNTFIDYYLKRKNNNLYPIILIPHQLISIFHIKPKYNKAKVFGSLSQIASTVGLISIVTPISIFVIIICLFLIRYDFTDLYQERKDRAKKENKKIKEILNNQKLLDEYRKNLLVSSLDHTGGTFIPSDAKEGKYDSKLFAALSKIQNCEIFAKYKVVFEGDNSSYSYTPDVILHFPSLNLWIDVENDEPWYIDQDRIKQPIHYVGKDSIRNSKFLSNNWIVFRFSEEQIKYQSMSCAKEIAKFLQLFDLDLLDEFINIDDLNISECWDIESALLISRH